MITTILYQSRSGWEWLADAVSDYAEVYNDNVSLGNIYRTLYCTSDSVFIGNLPKTKDILKKSHNIQYQFNPLPFHKESWVYGRDIELSETNNLNNSKGIFVRPTQPKEFPAQRLYGNKVKDWNGQYLTQEAPCYYSDIIPNISSEWRFYLTKDINSFKYIHAANYSGDVRMFPNQKYLDSLLRWINMTDKTFPCSFAVDIAVLSKNTPMVIEFNDFVSLGNYGLDGATYINSCIKRWKELTSVK